MVGGEPRGDSALTGLAWWLLDDRPRTGAENMAMDHALAELLPPGRAVLRLYEWTLPTVSFGRHEPTRGRYSRREGMGFVRRPTGGRAVLHRDELTYSVVFPAVRGLRAAYVEIHEALKAALAKLGVRDGRLAAPGLSASPVGGGTCFEQPVGGEVLVPAGKLVGSAQARLEGAILQHGSLLRVEDQTALESLRGEGTGEVRPAATLAGVLGRAPSVPALRGAVRHAFAERFGSLTPWEETDVVEGRARDLLGTYGSEAWTWRR